MRLAVVVVSEPEIEEIPENVERARRMRLVVEKSDEALDDVRTLPAQVDVGDEERGHCLARTSGRLGARSSRAGPRSGLGAGVITRRPLRRAR